MRGSALMAQDHKLQDTRSTSASKVAKQDRVRLASPPSAAKAPGPFALCALGVNAWALCGGWTLLAPDVSVHHALSASAGLVLLGLGALLRARAEHESWHMGARWLLLCAYPVSLSAALCLGSEASRERAHSAASMTWAAMSLLAYGTAALQACRVQLPVLPVKSHQRQRERTRRVEPMHMVRWVAAGCIVVGALAIALVAPLSSDYAQLEAAWGDAADAGATLTAVVAGAIAIALVGVELGPLMRAQRSPRLSPRGRPRRIAAMLFFAAIGGTVYVLALL